MDMHDMLLMMFVNLSGIPIYNKPINNRIHSFVHENLCHIPK